MTTATANDLSVINASIRAPRVGAWRAELDIDGSDATKVTGKVTIKAGDTVWVGTSKPDEVGAFVGRIKVRIVGGAAGLTKPTTAKFYHSIPARTVIED